MTAVAGAGKPPEVQGLLDRLVYHPAAARLARSLAATPVTPNAVSVAGAVMVVTTAVLYALVATPVAIAAGFALHLLWHVVDGADGDLARMTGRASPTGEIVDGLCDYGGHVVLYVMLAATLDNAIGGWAWVLAVSAGASRIVQSVYAESMRRTYRWWAYGTPWLRTAAPPRAGGLPALYLRVSRGLEAGTTPIDRLVAAAADPAERRRIAGLAREAGRRTLPAQRLLGANARTVLLGLGMIAGGPAWFFVVEATLLNLVLVGSIAQQRRTSRRLLRLIARGRG